LNPFVFVRLA